MSRGSNKQKPAPPLHTLEAKVMEEVWRQDRATVRQVLDALNSGQRKRAYTTVMTIMARLDKKGLLTRERVGKTDVYAPVLDRAEYMNARAAAQVGALVDEYGDLALSHFARQFESLDARSLRRLRALSESD